MGLKIVLIVFFLYVLKFLQIIQLYQKILVNKRNQHILIFICFDSSFNNSNKTIERKCMLSCITIRRY